MERNQIKGLILDMDGVLWRDKQPIGDLGKIFRKIDTKGLKYVFATNNSTKSTEVYSELLGSHGIEVFPEKIITSATATAQHLLELYPGKGNIYVVGMAGLENTLRNYGFKISEEAPLAVVVGMDQSISYDKLRTATLLIRSGVPFIGTNPDKTFPSPAGLIPGAGSIIAAIQAATETEPVIIGKPMPTMFQQALNYLGEKAEDVLVIGDRLETDIAGGKAAGCKCALVLTGVSSREMGKTWKPELDLISKDLESLIDLL